MQSDRRTLTRTTVLTVAAHALVSLVHGRAHQALGVSLTLAQSLFVVLVVFIAPIAAGTLLAIRATPRAALLLALSMAASLVFGIYYHFVEVSPDHVGHRPAGPPAWTVTFLASAVALMIVEILGMILAITSLTFDVRAATKRLS